MILLHKKNVVRRQRGAERHRHENNKRRRDTETDSIIKVLYSYNEAPDAPWIRLTCGVAQRDKYSGSLNITQDSIVTEPELNISLHWFLSINQGVGGLIPSSLASVRMSLGKTLNTNVCMAAPVREGIKENCCLAALRFSLTVPHSCWGKCIRPCFIVVYWVLFPPLSPYLPSLRLNWWTKTRKITAAANSCLSWCQW